PPAVDQSICFGDGRSRYDQYIGTMEHVIQLLRRRYSLDKCGFQLTNFSADCTDPHAERVRTMRNFAPDRSQTNNRHSPSAYAPWPHVPRQVILNPAPLTLGLQHQMNSSRDHQETAHDEFRHS